MLVLCTTVSYPMAQGRGVKHPTDLTGHRAVKCLKQMDTSQNKQKLRKPKGGVETGASEQALKSKDEKANVNKFDPLTSSLPPCLDKHIRVERAQHLSEKLL